MVRISGILASALAVIMSTHAAESAAAPCLSACIGKPVPFASCDDSVIERVEPGRIAIIGRVVEYQIVEPQCRRLVLIEVLKASKDKLPSPVQIDGNNNCTRWNAGIDDVIKFQVYSVPTVGAAYALAPCPR